MASVGRLSRAVWLDGTARESRPTHQGKMDGILDRCPRPRAVRPVNLVPGSAGRGFPRPARGARIATGGRLPEPPPWHKENAMHRTLLATILALLGTALLAAEDPTRGFHFGKTDVGKVPAGWTPAQTGKGEGSVWKVVADDTAPSK